MTDMTDNTQAPRLTRRGLLRAASVGAGALALGNIAACTSERPAPRGSSGAVTLGMANTFQALDAHVAFDVGAISINNNFIYEGLYRLDPRNRATGEYQTELAEGPLEQIDARTYRCAIRPDATFHNGAPVTADDVVFSFERLKDPDLKSFFTPYFAIIDSVKALDTRSVEIKLSYPTAVAADRIAMAKIMSRKHVESATKEQLGLEPVGSGPYRVARAVSNELVEMRRFADYNGPRPGELDKVTVRVMLDGNARVSALRSGRAQAIEEVPYASIAALLRGDGVDVGLVPGWGVSNMLFHCGKPPFDDKRVRQAFMYAIDRDAIATSVFHGKATSAKGFLGDDHPFFTEPKIVYSYDPDKAKALLKAAGHGKGFSTELLISNEDFIRPQGDIVRQNLADVGIKVELKPGEALANLAHVANGSYFCYLTQSDFSMYTWEPDLLLSIIYTGAVPKTLTYWQNAASAQVAKLLARAERSTSAGERRKLLGQVQDIIADEVPHYPIHRRQQPTGWRDTLTGLKPLPTPGFELGGVRSA